MAERTIIDITDHPVITGITRKAQVKQDHIYYQNKLVMLTVNIFHYFNGVELTYFPKQVEMVCDNSMINPTTFQYVEKDENGDYPTGSVGEYDFLYSLVESKTKTIFELEEMFIGLRAEKINAKLYS